MISNNTWPNASYVKLLFIHARCNIGAVSVRAYVCVMCVCGFRRFLRTGIFFSRGTKRHSDFFSSHEWDAYINFCHPAVPCIRTVSVAGTIICLHVRGSQWHPGGYENTFHVILLVYVVLLMFLCDTDCKSRSTGENRYAEQIVKPRIKAYCVVVHCWGQK